MATDQLEARPAPTHVLLLVIEFSGNAQRLGARELGRGSLDEMLRAVDLVPAVAVSDPDVQAASLHVVTVGDFDALVRGSADA